MCFEVKATDSTATSTSTPTADPTENVTNEQILEELEDELGIDDADSNDADVDDPVPAFESVA